ncbi:hypothetical protein GCM10023347_26510 [Streptomyces chumphonensis]
MAEQGGRDRVVVSFPGVGAREAGVLAADLAEFLHAEVPQAAARQQRADAKRQDAGALVALAGALSLGVGPILARGVARWMAKRSVAQLHLVRRRAGSGEVTTELTLEGRPSARTMKVIEWFLEDTAQDEDAGAVGEAGE